MTGAGIRLVKTHWWSTLPISRSGSDPVTKTSLENALRCYDVVIDSSGAGATIQQGHLSQLSAWQPWLTGVEVPLAQAVMTGSSALRRFAGRV